MERANRLPLFAFLVLCLGLWATLTYKPAAPSPVGESQQVPALSLARLKDGKTLAWKPAADRITVLNFFASWCQPCLAELPQIEKLGRIPGVELQGVAWNDKPADVTQWLTEHGTPYAHVWLDTTGRAAMDLGLRGVPETFVIDRDGKVRLHIQGSILSLQMPRLRSVIAQLQEEPHATVAP